MHGSVRFCSVRLAAVAALAALILLPSRARTELKVKVNPALNLAVLPSVNANCLITCSQSDEYLTRENVREFPLAQGKRFTLENQIGSITVSDWDKETVSVREVRKVKKSFFNRHSGTSPEEAMDRVVVAYEMDSAGVRVITTVNKMHTKNNHTGVFEAFRMIRGLFQGDCSRFPLEVDYEVRVPTHCNLDLNNDIGKIKVSGVKGDLSLDQDMGDVQIEGTEGGLYARLDMGKIEIQGHCGAVDAKTGMGQIQAELTSFGSEDRVELESGMGEVDLTLPREAAIDIDADCGLGSVNNNLGGSFKGNQRNSHLTGQFNGGGSQVMLKTGMGAIEIAEK